MSAVERRDRSHLRAALPLTILGVGCIAGVGCSSSGEELTVVNPCSRPLEVALTMGSTDDPDVIESRTIEAVSSWTVNDVDIPDDQTASLSIGDENSEGGAISVEISDESLDQGLAIIGAQSCPSE